MTFESTGFFIDDPLYPFAFAFDFAFAFALALALESA